MAKLFMLLIGATPPGRHTEQHDVFFGIGETIRDVLPQVLAFWPEAKKGLHLDAWREVTLVNGYKVEVIDQPGYTSDTQLFFINLGGYKQGEFEEFHYKMIVAASGKGEAISLANKRLSFATQVLKEPMLILMISLVLILMTYLPYRIYYHLVLKSNIVCR